MDYELMMNGNVKIGQMAPDFEAETTYGKRTMQDYKGKWLVLFSHPGDFTPVSAFNLGIIFILVFQKQNVHLLVILLLCLL